MKYALANIFFPSVEITKNHNTPQKVYIYILVTYTRTLIVCYDWNLSARWRSIPPPQNVCQWAGSVSCNTATHTTNVGRFEKVSPHPWLYCVCI